MPDKEAPAITAQDIAHVMKPLKREDIAEIALNCGLSISAAATHLGAQQKERPRDSRYNVSRKPDGFALPMVSGTVDQLEHFAHAVLRHSLGN